MRAAVGDRLRLGGRSAGSPQRTGQIVEIRGTDGEPPYLVRFSDGRTSLVIPGPGAVIEPSGPVQRVSAGRSGEPLPGLMFRVTASQRRALAIIATIAATLAAATGAAAAASGSGRLAAFAAGIGISALLTLYYAVAYAAAYTKCSPAGLGVRGVAGPRYLPWARLREITVRDYGSSPYRRRSGRLAT